MFQKSNISISGLSDEKLMQKSAAGDQRAFEGLYHRYFDKLAGYARSFGMEAQKAEDIVQEVFMKIINKPESFDDTRRFSTWIYTLTANLCKNQLRNEQNRMRILNETPVYSSTAGPANRIDAGFLRQKITLALSEMTEKERSVYSLRIEQELSLKEIAEILDIPEGSVKSCLYYLLKKLSKHLKDFKYEL